MKFLRTCSIFTLIVTSMLPVGGMSQTVRKTTPPPAYAQNKQPASPLSIDCPGANPSARAVKANSQTPMPAQKGKTYGKAPLSFELNQGQTDPQVKFLTRGSGYNLFLTDTEVVMMTSKPAAAERAELKTTAQKQGQDSRVLNRRDSLLPAAPRAVVSNIVRMKLAGANPHPTLTGLEETAKKTNIYIGNDSSKWRTNISNYKKVKYENALPNVDMVFHGNQGLMEYDFIVRPGAAPADITLNFEGVRSLRIDSGGDLVMQLAEGKLLHRKPYIYQETAGKKREIAGKYVLKGANRVGFEVGAYDKAQPLIIDPVIVYATYLGGSIRDLTEGIAVDSAGNAFVTGVSVSMDFPVSNAFQGSAHEYYFEGFVTKLNADGSDVIFSTYLGGSYQDDGKSIAVDSAGNAYVTGFTTSPDFPTSTDAFQRTGGGTCSYDGGDSCSEAYVTKLSPGGSLIYSTYIGGSDSDFGRAVAVDSAGNAYVTGTTESSNFPVLGALQSSFGGGSRDVFLTKINATGTAILYSTYLGGTEWEFGDGVAVDNVGGAYLSGVTISNNFPTTPGAYSSTGQRYGFITKINTTATGSSSLVYSTNYLGGGEIAVDALGHAYVGDGGITKLNPSGSALIYRTPYPTAGNAAPGEIRAIAIDSDGNAFVTGAVGTHIYLARVNAEGLVDYATSIGGSGGSSGGLYPSIKGEHGRGIAVDPMGNAYVTGWTASVDFPVTPGAFQTVLPAHMEDNPFYNESSFVMKVTDCPCACPAIPVATPRVQ